ncbi:hypothetical protein Val02_72150 [Virgisporangium aliadipatigenens]|uniref:Uncharacterized protein n=1 Tax=Virgisporangium aliadipatigenens TaxID=741659 RepID=A0A8J3YR61_9ACTN|nr:type VII secretion system-associated protein [Virgisporangium aliadipatigenens]GIJ50329.1 hypothetical protein Val02_72150 [Virgisporangium aliadipatigenens]
MPDFHIPNDPEWQWVYTLILYGVGEEFPEANPTELREMAGELNTFAAKLLGAAHTTGTIGFGLHDSLQGPAAEAFFGVQGQFASGAPKAARTAVVYGLAASDFATDSESTQYGIVIAAFTQVWQIAMSLASGFGAAAVPGLIKAGQEVVRGLVQAFKFRRLNSLETIAYETLQEGLEEAWQSAAAQGIQIAEGNRKTLDMGEIALSFAGGLFIGLGVSGVAVVGGKLFPKFMGNWANREVGSALAETLFEGLFSAMLGAGFNPGATFTSALVGGIAQHYADEYENAQLAALEDPPHGRAGSPDTPTFPSGASGVPPDKAGSAGGGAAPNGSSSPGPVDPDGPPPAYDQATAEPPPYIDGPHGFPPDSVDPPPAPYEPPPAYDAPSAPEAPPEPPGPGGGSGPDRSPSPDGPPSAAVGPAPSNDGSARGGAPFSPLPGASFPAQASSGDVHGGGGTPSDGVAAGPATPGAPNAGNTPTSGAQTGQPPSSGGRTAPSPAPPVQTPVGSSAPPPAARASAPTPPSATQPAAGSAATVAAASIVDRPVTPAAESAPASSTVDGPVMPAVTPTAAPSNVDGPAAVTRTAPADLAAPPSGSGTRPSTVDDGHSGRMPAGRSTPVSAASPVENTQAAVDDTVPAVDESTSDPGEPSPRSDGARSKGRHREAPISTAEAVVDPPLGRRAGLNPGSSRDSGVRPGIPSVHLHTAFAALPPWTGADDCLERVEQVLAPFGAPVTARDDLARPEDLLEGRLGGRFGRADRSALAALPVGHSTAVRLEEPDRRPHVVVVERVAADAFVYAETQVRASGTGAVTAPPGGTFRGFGLDALRGDAPMPDGIRLGAVRLAYRDDGTLASVHTATAPPAASMPIDTRTVRRYLDERRPDGPPDSVAPTAPNALWESYTQVDPSRFVGDVLAGEPGASETARFVTGRLTGRDDLPPVRAQLKLTLTPEQLTGLRGDDDGIGFPAPLVVHDGHHTSPTDGVTVVVNLERAVAVGPHVVVPLWHRFRLQGVTWDDGIRLSFTDAATATSTLDGTPPPTTVSAADVLTAMYGEIAGPSHIPPQERHPDGAVRLSPAWRRLDDPGVVAALANAKDVRWNFSVDPDGVVHLAPDVPGQTLTDAERDELFTRMHAKTGITRERFRELLGLTGHPTIAVGFDERGNTVVRPARVSGELRFDHVTDAWWISDRSGRYMSARVRPVVARDAQFWLANTARLIGRTLNIRVLPEPSSFGSGTPDPNRVRNQANVFVSEYVGPAPRRAALHAFVTTMLRSPNHTVEDVRRHAGTTARALGLQPGQPAAVGAVPPDRTAETLALAATFYGPGGLSGTEALDRGPAVWTTYLKRGSTEVLAAMYHPDRELKETASAVVAVVTPFAASLIPVSGVKLTTVLPKSVFDAIDRQGHLELPAPFVGMPTVRTLDAFASPGPENVRLVLAARPTLGTGRQAVVPAGRRFKAVRSVQHDGGGFVVECEEQRSALLVAEERRSSPRQRNRHVAERLAGWIRTVESPLPAGPAELAARTLGAFVAAHPDVAVPPATTFEQNPDVRVDVVPQALHTAWRSTDGVPRADLWQALRRRPGAMVLVHDPRTGAAAWLLADDRSGVVVPRWVDTTEPGLFDQPAVADTRRMALLNDLGTRMLFLDPDGRVMTTSEFVGPSFAGLVNQSQDISWEERYQAFFNRSDEPEAHFGAVVSAEDVTRGLAAAPGSMTIVRRPGTERFIVGVSRSDPMTDEVTIEWLAQGRRLSTDVATRLLSAPTVAAATWDPAGAPVPVSGRLAAAVRALPPWTGGPECAIRVASVLGGYRVVSTSDTDGSRPIDDVGRRLGGRFRPAGLDVLRELRQGAHTVVRIDPAGARPHLVIVERQHDGTFTMVELEASTATWDGFAPGTFTSFDLADLTDLADSADLADSDDLTPFDALVEAMDLPEDLRRPIALPFRPDDTLAQVDHTGPVASHTVHTGHPLAAALLDPPVGSPGMPRTATASTQPYPSGTGPTDVQIEEAVARVRGYRQVPDNAQFRRRLATFLRTQAHRDGGWTDTWPTAAYTTYFVEEGNSGPPVLAKEVTRALTDNPVVAVEAVASPAIVLLLRHDPTRVAQLTQVGWQRVLNSPAVHLALRADPSALDAMLADPVLESYVTLPGSSDVTLLQQYPRLYADLGGDAEVFHALAGCVWGFIAAGQPGFREFLRRAEDRHSIAVRLRQHTGLGVLVYHRGSQMNLDDTKWGRIVRDPALLRDLDRYQSALPALAAPKVLDVALRVDREPLRLLATAPELADVLADAPKLVQRLVTGTGRNALRAAIANPAVAHRLSANPSAYDDVPTKELAGVFEGETAPAWTTATVTSAQGNAVQRALALNPGLGPVLSENRTVRTPRGPQDPSLLLFGVRSVQEALSAPLGLMPHEYHRLLRSLAYGIIVPPLPTLGTDVLRAMINSPLLASAMKTPVGPAASLRYFQERYPEQFATFARSLRTSLTLVETTVFRLRQADRYRTDPAMVSRAGENADYAKIFAADEVTWLLDAFDTERLERYFDSPDLVALTAHNPQANGAIGASTLDVVNHPHLLAVLGDLPGLADVGPRHWAALLNDPTLMSTLDTMLAAGGDTAKLARKVLAADVIAPFLELRDPTTVLTDPRLDAVLASDGHLSDTFPVRMTPDGQSVTAADLAAARAIADGSETSGEPHALLADETDVRAAVAGSLSLAVTVVRNPAVATLLRDSPLLRELAVAERAMRILLEDARFVAALATDPRLHAMVADRSATRQLLADDHDLRAALLENDGLARAFAIDVLYLDVQQRRLVGQLMVRDAVLATAIVDDEHLRRTLRVHADLTFHLMYAPPHVRRVVVSSRPVLDALTASPQETLHELASRPVLLEGLCSRRGLLPDARHVHELLRADSLLDLIERRDPTVHEALFANDGVLAFLLLRPEIVHAVAEQPDMAPLLTRKPVRALLKKHVAIVWELQRSADLRRLVTLPGTAEALASNEHLVKSLPDRPWLVQALRRDRTLIDTAREYRPGKDGLDHRSPWQALIHDQNLAETLTARSLRRLEQRPALVAALAAGPTGFTGTEWQQVLDDEPALDRLDALARDSVGGEPLAQAHRAPVGVSLPVHPRPAAPAPDAPSPPPERPEPADQGPQPETADPEPATASTVDMPAPRDPVGDGEGAWLNRVPRLFEHLRDASGTTLAGVLADSPELLQLMRTHDDIAASIAEHPHHAGEYTLRAFLAENPGIDRDPERDIARWAAALDIVADDDLTRQARAVWDAVVAERRAAEARGRAETANRRVALDPADPSTWHYSGVVRYAGQESQQGFDAAELDVLRRLAEGGVGVREKTLALNAARHAHLRGGDQGVTFAFVVNEEWTVDLLVYSRSEGRNDRNQYRWRGNGGRYTSGPAPLNNVHGDAALTSSVRRVPERGGTPVPDVPPPTPVDNPLGVALRDYHRAFAATAVPARTGRKKKKKALTEPLTDRNAALRSFGVADRVLNPDVAGLADPSWPALGPRLPDEVLRRDYPWLAEVNPLGFDTNCVIASIATDLSLAEGTGHRASDATTLNVSDLSRYADHPIEDVSGYDVVTARMAAQPVGARGILVVDATAESHSHVFNVVRRADGVYFLDGQAAGRDATDSGAGGAAHARAPRHPQRIRFLLTGTASRAASGDPGPSTSDNGGAGPTAPEAPAPETPEPEQPGPETHGPETAEPETAEPGPAAAASLHDAVTAAARSGGRTRLSMVDSSTDTVTVTHGRHDSRLRVVIDPHADAPHLALAPDSAHDVVTGRRRPAVLTLPPGLTVEETTRQLVRFGTQLAHEAATATRIRALVRGARTDRLTPGSRPRWLRGLSPADRGRIRSLADRLTELAAAPEDERGPAEDRVLDELRGLGAFRDRTGGARRAETVLRRMAAAGVLRGGTAEQVLRRLWDTRTEAGTEQVVEALDRAGRSLLAHSPHLVGAFGITRDGGSVTLRVAAGTDGPVTPAAIRALPVRVLSVDEWRGLVHSRDDAVVSRDGRLWVRSDASDAAIATELAGHLARRAWRQSHPDASEVDLIAVGLVAEHEAVRRQHFAVRRRARAELGLRPSPDKRSGSAVARAVRAHTTGRYAERIIRAPLDRIERRARDHLAAQQRNLSPERRTDLQGLRGRVDGAYVAPELSGKAPPLIHVIRRLGGALPSAALAAASGTVVGRSPTIIGNSAANTTVFAVTQGVADTAAAALNSAGASGPVLADREAAEPVARYRKPARGGPSTALVKQMPAGALSAIYGLLIAGPATGNWALGSTVLASGAAQSVALFAATDYLADRAEDVAKGRFGHYYAASPDHRRNAYVEALHYFGFELQDRLRATGAGLPEADVAKLRLAKDRLEAMRRGMRAEVGNRLRELNRRRDYLRRVREAVVAPKDRPRITYDPVDRGVPQGRARIWHNAAREAFQHFGMQLPMFTVAAWTGNGWDLAKAMLVASVPRGLGYGAGGNPERAVALADSVAVAAFDALRQVDQAIELMDALIDPTRAPAERDRAASTVRHPWLRKLSERAALAVDQNAVNRRARTTLDDGTTAYRPAVVPWIHQLLFKHVPGLVGQSIGYGIAAGVGWLATGPLIPIVLGAGVAVQVGTAVGETLLRTNEPVYAQVARDRAARAEVAGLPLDNGGFVAAVDAFTTLADTAHRAIVPVQTRPWRGAHRRVYSWTVDTLTRKAYRAHHLERRLRHRAGDLLHHHGPVLSRTPGRPSTGLRLTHLDRGEVAHLREILDDLATARDPRATARTDLDVVALRHELAIVLDDLGLRAEQPDSAGRWAAVRRELRRTHHLGDTAIAEVEQLRQVPLRPPDDADAEVLAVAAAVRVSRAGHPSRERLWAAVDHLHAARPGDTTWYDVRDNGATLHVATPRGAFTLTVTQNAAERSTLTLPADDAVHAAVGRHRGGTTLRVTPDVAADPERFATALRNATEALTTYRSSVRHRIGQLWRSTVDSLTVPIGTTAPPPAVHLPDGAGLSLLATDDAAHRELVAAHTRNGPGPTFRVYGHGGRGVLAGRSPAEIAGLIKSDPHWAANPRDIDLVNCDLGPQFIAELATHFPGLTVTGAHEGTVWATPDGDVYIAGIDRSTGVPRPAPESGAEQWDTARATRSRFDAASGLTTDRAAQITRSTPRQLAARTRPRPRPVRQSHLPGTTAPQRLRENALPFWSPERPYGRRPIVDTAEYTVHAERFESTDLPRLIFARPGVSRALRATAQRLLEVLEAGGDERALRSFVMDDPTSAGQVGTAVDDAQIRDLLRQGNPREILTAIYNAAFYNRRADGPTLKSVVHDIFRTGDWDRAAALGLDVDALKARAAQFHSRARTVANASTTLVGRDDYTDVFSIGNLVAGSARPWTDLAAVMASRQNRTRSTPGAELPGNRSTPGGMRRVGVPLSAREEAFQRASNPGIAGDLADGTELTWRSGHARFTMRNGLWRRAQESAGMPTNSGISGTTARLLMAFDWLRVPDVSREDFLLALIAWNLHTDEHSLFEILRGAEIVGSPIAVSTFTAAEDMYRALTTLGLPLQLLRDASSASRMLPHEAAYAEKATSTSSAGLLAVTPAARTMARLQRELLKAFAESDSAAEELIQDPRWLSDGPAALANMRRWLRENNLNARVIGSQLTDAHLLAMQVFLSNSYVLVNAMWPTNLASTLTGPAALRHHVLKYVDAQLQKWLGTSRQPKLHPLPPIEADGECRQLLDAMRDVGKKDPTALRALHARLRARAEALLPRLAVEMKMHLDMVTDTLQILPPTAAVTVYRGTWGFGPVGSAGLPLRAVGGERITFPTLTSTSRERSIGLEFVNNHANTLTTHRRLDELHSKGYSGRDVSGLAEYDEFETTLLAGASFRVRSRGLEQHGSGDYALVRSDEELPTGVALAVLHQRLTEAEREIQSLAMAHAALRERLADLAARLHDTSDVPRTETPAADAAALREAARALGRRAAGLAASLKAAERTAEEFLGAGLALGSHLGRLPDAAPGRQALARLEAPVTSLRHLSHHKFPALLTRLRDDVDAPVGEVVTLVDEIAEVITEIAAGAPPHGDEYLADAATMNGYTTTLRRHAAELDQAAQLARQRTARRQGTPWNPESHTAALAGETRSIELFLGDTDLVRAATRLEEQARRRLSDAKRLLAAATDKAEEAERDLRRLAGVAAEIGSVRRSLVSDSEDAYRTIVELRTAYLRRPATAHESPEYSIWTSPTGTGGDVPPARTRAVAAPRQGAVLVVDPAVSADRDGAVPLRAVVGRWPVDSGGSIGRFVANPDYLATNAFAPTDPLDAVIRMAADGRVGPECLLLALREGPFDLATDARGRPLLRPAPDGRSCIVLATSGHRRLDSGAARWRRADLTDLVTALPDGVDLLVNPGSPAVARLGGDLVRNAFLAMEIAG